MPNHPPAIATVRCASTWWKSKGSTPTGLLLAEYRQSPNKLGKAWCFSAGEMRMTVNGPSVPVFLGLKIQVSGAPHGAEIARTRMDREGRVPLHTLRADIDYATRWPPPPTGCLGSRSGCSKGRCFPWQKGATARRWSTSRRDQPASQEFEDRSNKECQDPDHAESTTRQIPQKQRRPHVRCRHSEGNTLPFGSVLPLQAQECGWITIRQIESQPPGPMTRYVKRARSDPELFPDKPVQPCAPAETRMGSP